MGFAGVMEDSGSIVLNVAEAVADSLDAFDEVIHRFGDYAGIELDLSVFSQVVMCFLVPRVRFELTTSRV